MKLKIYTGKEYLRSGAKYTHIPLLYPFWGECDSGQEHIDHGRFDEFTDIGNKLFSLVSMDEADVFVLPSEWPEDDHYPEANGLFEKASDLKKQVLIFFNNDSDKKIPVENAIIFRTSFYFSKRMSNEFSLPAWNIDFLNYLPSKKLLIREKSDVPTISYCGYVDYYKVLDKSFAYHIARSILYGSETNPGKPLRGKAVRILKNSHKVNSNFIIRLKTLNYNDSSSETTRLEYFQNILNSDYALVIRGKGNFSYRLYEVLSCGRIPVFVNTECVLPFEDIIDWKKYMVWVEADEINAIADKVAEFHAALSEDEFQQLQISIRKLYKEWISPIGFYSNMWKCFRPFKIEQKGVMSSH